ncbi:unnamed protein product [Vitrella brassicaformis CCMP3155]|uniref:Uncharacterized protein n=1 Tax=Vitrella brassicaformis (strain CCMP3155) TaxID=1169540 RepID=A0A0G4EWM3_VITBC|nr:unnamed protein product [Vitrella brassicaformis CCMP3155]|eukprot:CEM02464.1 unnamed protein product [Vitrella brassicaformis CCMP3155]
MTPCGVSLFSVRGAFEGDGITKIEVPEDAQRVEVAGTQGAVTDDDGMPCGKVCIAQGRLWLGLGDHGPAGDLRSCQVWVWNKELPDDKTYVGTIDNEGAAMLASSVNFPAADMEIYTLQPSTGWQWCYYALKQGGALWCEWPDFIRLADIYKLTPSTGLPLIMSAQWMAAHLPTKADFHTMPLALRQYSTFGHLLNYKGTSLALEKMDRTRLSRSLLTDPIDGHTTIDFIGFDRERHIILKGMKEDDTFAADLHVGVGRIDIYTTEAEIEWLFLSGQSTGGVAALACPLLIKHGLADLIPEHRLAEIMPQERRPVGGGGLIAPQRCQ